MEGSRWGPRLRAKRCFAGLTVGDGGRRGDEKKRGRGQEARKAREREAREDARESGAHDVLGPVVSALLRAVSTSPLALPTKEAAYFFPPLSLVVVPQRRKGDKLPCRLAWPIDRSIGDDERLRSEPAEIGSWKISIDDRRERRSTRTKRFSTLAELWLMRQ